MSLVLLEEVMGGAEAAERWERAMEALQLFAHAAGAAPGENVVRFFSAKTDEYYAALPGKSRDGSPLQNTPQNGG